MRILLDTNVLISAFVFGGTAGQLLEKLFKDKKVFRLPYKAFIKEFPLHAKKISKSHYNGLIDPNKHPYDEDENGEKYEKIFKL